MHLTVNGEPKEVDEELTILALMETLGVKPEITAVQHNETIVDRKEVGRVHLQDGDIVELIRVVGGG